MNTKAIARFIHSRWLLIIMAILTIAGAWAYLVFTPGEGVNVADRGIVFPSANLWFSNRWLSAVIAVAATLGIAALMQLLNRTFALLRASTVLDASLFLAMSLSTPALLTSFNSGILLALTLLGCLFLLYYSYGNGRSMYSIFLIFFLLSGMTMTQYCYAAYLPVFALGLLQMRVFSARTLLAALLGIFTPWWLVLGSTLVPLSAVHFPELHLFMAIDTTGQLLIVASAAISALLLAGGWVMNFPQMIAYNAHMRAYNGNLSVLSLVTVLALCIDFGNIIAYLPVLYLCASFQLGRLFAGRGRRMGAVAIIIVILLFMSLYLCNIALSQ